MKDLEKNQEVIIDKLNDILSLINNESSKTNKHEKNILIAISESDDVLVGNEIKRQFPIYTKINDLWKLFARDQKNLNVDLVSLALFEFIEKYSNNFDELLLNANIDAKKNNSEYELRQR